jgi:hypothetical protein
MNKWVQIKPAVQHMLDEQMGANQTWNRREEKHEYLKKKKRASPADWCH